ncbi:hypothetical protein K437DRAFT_259290 [Tilletiaria anomala UBC 951]|uniref:Protein EFR3 n=1 Tax=Tilletiaria anomala (strain ATCC 24038 / CBS 436.72 / UBC 951) TaxID=1037660 RepID=A0A066VBG0_TILAU|nr:uncharacterized protein K437DRAFT_259290 [Tilletiaria anomala UBC 951]KDN38791.1 hypothetical protein K437DRAFT_259290 [Tilletiaria anomala UBC 951]
MCIPKSNHRNLVDTCYPAPKALANIGPDYRPNGNELSRLAYYASNKPAKLLKVGQYLEHSKVRPAAKRVTGSGKTSDAAKSSLMVSLAITKTLIVECKQSLNYLLPSAQAILLAALSAAARGAPGGKRDLDLSARCASVFYALCTLTDPQLASIDTHARSAYHAILSEFAAMAQASTPADAKADREDRNRTKLIGIAALSGAVSGDLLYQASFAQQVAAFLPALLHNVVSSNDDASPSSPPLSSPGSSDAVDVAFLRDEAARAASGELTYTQFRIKRQPLATRRAASIDVSATAAHRDGEKGPTARDTASAALGVLQALLAHGDASYMQIILHHTLAFFDNAGKGRLWAQQAWCTWLMHAYVLWAAPQYRFVVVSALADRLIEVSDDDDGSSNSAPAQQQQQETLLTLLSNILCSPSLSLIGLSTSELVNNLLGLAVRRVHRARAPEDLDTDALLPMIVEAVGALGQHIYYAEQMTDIAEEVCARIEMLQMPDEENQKAAQHVSASQQGGKERLVAAASKKGKKAAQNSVATATAQQKDESIRVLLYCLMTALRKAHASQASTTTSSSSSIAKGHASAAGNGSAVPKKAAVAAITNRSKIPLSTLQGIAGLLSWPSAVARLPFEQTLALFLRHEVGAGASFLGSTSSGTDEPGSVSASSLLTLTPADTHASVDASIGTLHALAASTYVTALSRALFVPEKLRQYPLEALVLVERANADVLKPIKPDAIASANPVDYAAMQALLVDALHALPLPAVLAFVPMLAKLEPDAAARLGPAALGASFGDLEAQRLVAIKRVVANAYAAIARVFVLPSVEAAAQKALSKLPKSDNFLPDAPPRLAPPDNVYQFRKGPLAEGFDPSGLLPVLDAQALSQSIARCELVQRATGLRAVDLQAWLDRDWSVSIAVDDSFIAASPFRDDLPPESDIGAGVAAGGAAYSGTNTPVSRGSVAAGAGLLPNTYGGARAGNASVSESMLSVTTSLQGDASGRANETGVQDLRDALLPKSTYTSAGVLIANGSGASAGVADTSVASTSSHAARRASRRNSRRTLAAGGVVTLLDSLNVSSLQSSSPSGEGQRPAARVVPPYSA